MLHGSVGHCGERAHTGKRREHHCRPFWRRHIQRGRKCISDDSFTGEDRNRDVMVRARSGGRIKQVMKASARLELRTVAARRAYRTIEKVHVGGERVRLARIRETHTPRPAVRVTPNSFYFAAAHIS